MRLPAIPETVRRYGVRAAIALTVVSAVAVGAILWRAHTTLRDTAARLAESGVIRFRLSRLERTLPVGFSSLAAPAVFRDAAVYHDLLYLCGPSGLYAYDASGKEVQRYRPGLELPPVPLAAIAAGAAADSTQPELWIATAGEGLLAFDGTAFRQIRPEQESYRKATSVLVLATGRVLFGTERAGLLVYDGKSIAAFHKSLEAGHVTAIAGDDASLWVGTMDRGLLHWHSGEADHFDSSSGLPATQVLSVAVDNTAAGGGRAWAGTPIGVAEFAAGRFSRLLGQGLVAQALLLRGDKLAVGTLEEGIFEIPLERGRARPGAATSLAGVTGPASVSRLIQYGGQTLAVSGAGVYLAESGGHGWTRGPAASGQALLTDRNVSAMLAGSDGRLWIGYFDRGLDILDSGGQVTHTENDRVSCVNRIVEDPQRHLAAVATANGLVLFDGQGRQRQVLTRADGLIADHVTDVLVRHGGLAVATPAGLSLVDTAGIRSLYAFHGLVNNHLYALAGSGDKLLVGTLGGLSVIEGETVRANYTTGNSRLKHNWITAIVPDGDAWMVGTYGAGVLRLDARGNWSGFEDLRPAFVVNPNAMLATSNAVYAGTLGQGLLAWRRSNGRWTRIADGIPSLNVTALAARGNTIYIGTDNGLVRVPEQDLMNR